MQNDVVIAFDFGFSKMGVAVGSKTTLTVSPLAQITARQGEPDWQAVDKLLAKWCPGGLVVGIPQTLDGKKQYTTKPARAFCVALQKLRLSARAYHRLLRLARTISDRQGEVRISMPAMQFALSFRQSLPCSS